MSSVNSIRPPKSLHDLSYTKTFTCDMGEAIPVMCDEVVPGDVFSIGNEMVIRFQPLVAPILHEINAYVHYFFVPYRLLWEFWEDFITGGKDGDFVAQIPTVTSVASNEDGIANTAECGTGYLWDYFGFPLVEGLKVNAFPFRAYNLVYNEYYRDPNLMLPLALDGDYNEEEPKYGYGQPKRRCWEKDYFTSSLPWQQRGLSPSLPLSGTGSAIWDNSRFCTGDMIGDINLRFHPKGESFETNQFSNLATLENIDKFKELMNSNKIDMSTVGTFDVNDLRMAFQVQRWLEGQARGGARYTETLRMHFSVSPTDERLQRPEYIGGSKSPIIVSEVLQTSGSNINGQSTPQGNLAGHALTADFNHVAKYRVKEYGLILGILSVMPRLSYNSQGINRQWLRTNKYDYYWPEFANLSEQAIYEAEIFATPTNNSHIFSDSLEKDDFLGYQGRYDEMRTKNNMVCGEMRDELSYWHLAQNYYAAPKLNNTFVECRPSKRIFAVQNRDGLVVQFGNSIKALRPIPITSTPGLVDHVFGGR